MGDRKRRNEEYEFQAPTSRAVNGNKRGRATTKAFVRSPSRSTSGSSSSSCADDSVGHMNAVRGDVLMNRCESVCCDIQPAIPKCDFALVRLWILSCFDFSHSQMMSSMSLEQELLVKFFNATTENMIKKLPSKLFGVSRYRSCIQIRHLNVTPTWSSLSPNYSSSQRYVESALIEGSVLDAVYSRQKKERTDFCVKMYSHFNLNGKYYTPEVLLQYVASAAVCTVSYSICDLHVILQHGLLNSVVRDHDSMTMRK